MDCGLHRAPPYLVVLQSYTSFNCEIVGHSFWTDNHRPPNFDSQNTCIILSEDVKKQKDWRVHFEKKMCKKYVKDMNLNSK